MRIKRGQLIVAVVVAAVLPVTEIHGVVVTMTVSGGGQVTVDGNCAIVDAAAVGAKPTLAGGITCDLTLDSVADILVIDADIQSDSGRIFSDVEPGNGASPVSPPLDALIPVFPELAAHSFVTTPGVSSSTSLDDGASELATERSYTAFDTTDDGPQSDFQWARFTFVPDLLWQGSATFNATIQTKSDPTPVFDEVTGVINFPLSEEPNFGYLLGALPATSDFATSYASNPSIATADDRATHPSGVSMFVPSNAALAGFEGQLSVDDLLVDGALSLSELEALVSNSGDASLLTAISGSEFTLENGSLLYGGATIVDTWRAENGWIHIVDGIPQPVPEPGALSLFALAMAGLATVRRQK